MSDLPETAHPPPSAPAEKVPAAVPPPPNPPGPGHRPWGWLIVLGFVVLAGAQAASWYRLLNPPVRSDPLSPRLQQLEDRVARLEARPAPSIPNVTPELTALATQVQQLKDQVGRLEARPAAQPTDLAPLTARIAALEQQVQAEKAAQTPPPLSVSPAQLDALAQRVQANETRLAAVEKTANTPSPEAREAARAARVQAVYLALTNGKPLGAIPDAPPALARYASTPPPTEAALRLAFPAAAAAALAARRPVAADKPWLTRLWARAQELITVQQGDQVLVGNPDAGVLARARTRLDAGDLAGAAAAVATLTGPPAQAMAAWLDQARGLLDARAALADMAAHR
jgi:hypothetical protein